MTIPTHQQTNPGGEAPQAPLAATDPLHQYARYAPPSQALALPYPGGTAFPPPAATFTPASPLLTAGLFGLLVASTGAMGINLHRVSDGSMTMTEAMGDSLRKGAVGGLAAASATAAASALTAGGIAGLAVTITAATGMSFLLGRP